MGNGELDRVNPMKVGIIHDVLAARAAFGFLAEQGFQRVGDGVERRNAAKPERHAACFEPFADFGADQCKQHQPGIAGDFAHDPVEMLLRTHHRPEMPDDVGAFKLRQCRLGDHVQGLAGGIRQEMKMKTLHGPFALSFAPVRTVAGMKLWISHG